MERKQSMPEWVLFFWRLTGLPHLLGLALLVLVIWRLTHLLGLVLLVLVLMLVFLTAFR